MTREEASYILRKFYADGYKSNNYSNLEQALQLAVCYLENSPHWISVEDELPPLECSMIVLISYGEDIQISEWDNGSFHEIKLGVIIHPTHWMPLPQPPKKGGEE